MKKLSYIIGCLFLMLFVWVSCDNEDNRMQTTGYLELGVSKNVEVVTRGFDVKDQSLAVDICTGANDSVVKHFSDYNDMAGERVLLEVGTYKVKVTSNPSDKLEFEKPTFYGDKDKIVIKAGETTQTAIECFLTCVKVTSKFTKPVQDKFASCVAKVSDATGSYWEYDMQETRAGYFQPGYLLVDLTLTNKEGLTFHMSKLIEKTEAKDHYHLVFDLVDSGEDNSGMDFDITIDSDPTNDENHTVTIPLPESGYGQEPPLVKVLEDGKDSNGMVSLDKGDSRNVMLNISSTNIGLESVTMIATSSLFDEHKISSSLDLLKLSEESKKKLAEIGLEVPALDDKKAMFTLVFDNLITQLPGGTHTFVLSARDEMGHETVQTISITVNLQIMTHPVVESEVWAHFATLRGYVKNASEEDKASYKFQYRKFGTDDKWSDVEGEVTVGNNGSSNVTQVVTHLDDGTKYEYRLLQNGAVAESKEFVTEEAVMLPYGDFEDKNNGPWNEKNSYWSSGNNTFTPDLCQSVTEQNNTKAFLKSRAAVGKFAAGNAFTGSFALSGMNGVVTLGKPFTARPSMFKGKYNYIPQTVDKYSGHIAKGSFDQCAIYIVLLKEPMALNTANQETLNWKEYYADRIIAYAELPASENMLTNGWSDFNLKLQYLKKDVKPEYIGVLATSSKYGDYFQGAVGSELYIDDFELVYDQTPTE